MKDNQEIVQVFEIKRQIDLAKVRIVTYHNMLNPWYNGESQTYHTAFVSKAEIPNWLKAEYYEDIRGDCLNPFEQDAEAYAGIERNYLIDALHERVLDLWRDEIDCGFNQGAYDAVGVMVDKHWEHINIS